VWQGQFGLAAVAVAVGVAALGGRSWAHGRPMLWPALGLVYLSVPAAALIWLRGGPDGAKIVFWILLVVWAVDIGAYAAGRGIGGPRLAPRISPGKTWAGLAGGMAAAGLVGGGGGVLLGLGGAVALAALGAVLAVVGQAGDLAESAFKRHFHAKDSGRLIPGHGGLLDRLDGLLAVAPVVALLVWWRLA
jgi:phosphatidate cytidylyltransferase